MTIDDSTTRSLTLSERIAAAFRLSTWLSLALLALIWIGTAYHLMNDREAAIRSSLDKTANIARVFEEHVANILKNVDKNLLFLRHARESDGDDFDLPAWTTNSYFLRDITVQMALIGPDGRLVSTNVARNAERMDLSDREHFRVHAERSSDELFVSKPVLGRATGKWTIQLTRRLTAPNGAFDGVLVASIDPYHLSKFFEGIHLGRNGAITLIGDDGLIRARGGLAPDVLGRSIAGSPLADALAGKVPGTFVGETAFSNGRRLLSHRHLDGFPLSVTVAEDEEAVLAQNAEARHTFVWIASGLSLVLVAVMLIGIGHELRLARGRLERAASEDRLAAKTQELEATLGRIGQGILMLDAGERVRIANRRTGELLGWSGDLAVGAPLPDELRLRIDAAEADGTQQEIRVADRDIAVAVTAMPDGGTLYAFTDVTAHRRSEAVLTEARDRAEAAMRTRTAFLATMSHELRTPLNGVVGAMRLLEDCDDPAERSLYVATIHRSAEHLLQIIDDILDITKLEADRVTFETAPYEVAAVVRSAIDLVAPHAQEKGLTIDCDFAADVPARLVGDAGRLRQVLVNLLGNAVKFTERGCVIARVDLRPAEADRPERLRIRVQDTGIGIAPESLGDLFVKFSQLDGSITRRFGGTGLGLAISRELVAKMGGEITVASVLGEGSTFTLLMPCEAAVGPETAPASIVALPRHTEPVAGLSILLAEDNPTNTLVARRLLEKMGHRVTAVVDGVEAVEALAAAPFDLVLMDMMMPRMDGLTAIRTIRAGAPETAAKPIVALTANALTDDRDAAFAAGADAYATKPVSREKLIEAIAEAMTAPRLEGHRDDAGFRAAERASA